MSCLVSQVTDFEPGIAHSSSIWLQYTFVSSQEQALTGLPVKQVRTRRLSCCPSQGFTSQLQDGSLSPRGVSMRWLPAPARLRARSLQFLENELLSGACTFSHLARSLYSQTLRTLQPLMRPKRGMGIDQLWSLTRKIHWLRMILPRGCKGLASIRVQSGNS